VRTLSETTNVNMRLPVQLVELIDKNATQQGMNRTAYILSYLPEHYERKAETTGKAGNGHRR
jgi:predicted DNA binding CopG/RHH family protein